MNSVGMYVTSMQTLCDCSNMLAVFANIVIVISSVMFKNCMRNSHFSFMASGLLGKNGVLDQSLSLCRWGLILLILIVTMIITYPKFPTS